MFHSRSLACTRPAAPLLGLAFLAGTLGLAGTGGAGCSPASNRDPTLLPLPDVTFEVNVPANIDLIATDQDGDDLDFEFTLNPEPATQTQSAGGRPSVNKLDCCRAVFQWTPGIADAGPNDQMAYAVTFKVKDGNGGEAEETLQIRVVNAGLGPASVVFVEPPGAGMAVDVAQTPCVDGMPVSVKADLVPDAEVELKLVDPPAKATLFPAGPGKRKSLSWCPEPEDLDKSLSHTLVFEARRQNDDQVVVKRFLIRFKRDAGANCPGAPPEVGHTAPSAFAGPLNYELVATVDDDVGIKSAPILAFTTEPASGDGAVDTSGWQLVEMAAVEGGGKGQYQASVPNLNLAEGETAEVSYVIIATDNDDPDGTRCDHTTETEVFSFTATGGGAAGETYGDCASCVADAQCGGEADHCVSLLGQFYCAHACLGGCGPSLTCVQLTSIDGVTDYQCIPANSDCGQVCAPDELESATGNETAATAADFDALAVDGGLDGLTICDQDSDVFRFQVAAQQSVIVRALFDNASGDLDLFMRLPGDPPEGYPYQSANADLDEEAVSEPCVPEGGEVIVEVAPFQGARNAYRLEVALGPGQCNLMCVDDEFDDVANGNDQLGDFTLIEGFPHEEGDRVICRLDPDFYGFDVIAGQIIRAGVAFSHRDGDLDVRLYRSSGQAVAESLSYRDVELVEIEAPADDIYVLEVFGATRSVSNVYDLTIELGESVGCQVTLQCLAGQFCRDGACIDVACDRPRGCGDAAECIAPQACQDPGAFGGSCADNCQSSFECRGELGYACKRFEDFSAGCLPAGPGRTGDRCQAHTDCEGTDICFPLPGGYCASGGCGDDDCPEGTLCADVPGDCAVPACLLACAGDEDCRAGYTCQPVSGGMACLP